MESFMLGYIITRT